MLSLCMIVKNEEQTLDKCLNSAKTLVDEIIIVDTGSTDKTKDIALKYTNKVYDFIWCNDFSKARNFSLAKASNPWVLVLDADEVVRDFNKDNIRRFCCYENHKTVGRLKRINEFEDRYGTKRYIERVNRVFNRDYFKYEGTIHEQIVHKDMKQYITMNIELAVNHVGYAKEVLNRTNKVQRNIELLKAALVHNPRDPYLHYQLGKSYFMNKNYNDALLSFKSALPLLDNFKYEYVQDLVESYGYTLINLSRIDEALSLQQYSRYYHDSPDFNFLLGLVKMNNGNFKEAVDIFLRCTEFTEGKVEGVTSFLPLYNIGVIFECLGFRDEALKYYKFCGDYGPALKRMKL